MAGHSKWAQIKRQKGAADAKRGQLFSKISQAIILAAKTGDTNPETNPALASAIQKAKSADMPKDVIERALLKAAKKDQAALDAFIYEAYGPGGAAILIEGITDNKNRATQEIKHILSEHGGTFARPGSVVWLFEKRGILSVPLSGQSRSPEDIELAAIDAGAETIDHEDDSLYLTVAPERIHAVSSALSGNGIAVGETKTAYVPKNAAMMSEDERERIRMLIEKLNDHPDVQDIYTNAVF